MIVVWNTNTRIW